MKVDMWPPGAISREEAVQLLAGPIQWRVEWCSGSDEKPVEGKGLPLPPDTLELVPTAVQRRKFESGHPGRRNYFMAFTREVAGETLLLLREGR